MSEPTDELNPRLREYLDRYRTYPRQLRLQRTHPMSVENPRVERTRRHPRILEVALTVGVTGILFVVLATAYVVAHSAHAPTSGSHKVGTAGSPKIATTPTARTSTSAAVPAGTSCSVLSVPFVATDYRISPPGSVNPDVSCGDAVAKAETVCPLAATACAGAPAPQTAQLGWLVGGAVAEYPGENVSWQNPGLLVWAVTWKPGNCHVPGVAFGVTSTPTLTKAAGCAYVDFTDASTGTYLFTEYLVPSAYDQSSTP
jgi:hypothetical protein